MRLIDADALFLPDEQSDKTLLIGSRVGKTVAVALKLMEEKVKNAPTIDAVQVTRCKDCHYSQEDDFDGSLWCHNGFNEREVDEMHFCGYAEPKARDGE